MRSPRLSTVEIKACLLVQPSSLATNRAGLLRSISSFQSKSPLGRTSVPVNAGGPLVYTLATFVSVRLLTPENDSSQCPVQVGNDKSVGKSSWPDDGNTLSVLALIARASPCPGDASTCMD